MLDDPENFGGKTIDLAGGVLDTNDLDPNTGSLVLGPGAVVLQDVAGTTARVGADVLTAVFGLGGVLNEGTIIVSAGTLDLDCEGGAFTSIFHLGPFTNLGTIEIGAGTTVVDDTNATYAGLGTIINTGGLLDLRGTLDNTAAMINVAATGEFSNLRLDGTVNGGTIVEAGGTLVIGSASLLGVTLLGTGVTFTTLTIGANTSFDPGGAPYVLTASDAGYGQIYLHDGADMANAAIAYGGTQYQIDFIVTGGSAPSAKLDASTVLNVGSGEILRLDAGTNGTLVDKATINVAAGGRLEFDNAASYVAAGTVNLAHGAEVVLNGNIGLAALSNIVGSGATLVNTGSLNLQGQTISSAGDAHFSAFINEGDIGNGTFLLAPGQYPNLGRIDPGTTLATGPGVYPVNTVTLNGGVLQGGAVVDTNGTVDIESNTTLSNTSGTGPGLLIVNQQPQIFVMGSATSIQFTASATLADAMVVLSGITTTDLSGAFTAQPDINVEYHGTATFAPDTMIVADTVNGPISGIGNQGYAVNQGTIVVTPGADFFVVLYGSTTSQDFANTGTITIDAGGTFDVATYVSVAQLGTVLGAGGLLRFDNNNFNSGPYDNSGHTLTVGGPTNAPNLELNHATISGGTIVNAGGSFTAINGILTNVTYVGPLHLTAGTDIFGATSAPYLAFNGGTLESQAVTIDPGGELVLGADQSFTGANLLLGGELADPGHTLSFDAATVTTIDGSVYMPAGHILNAGTIVVGAGGSLDMNDGGAVSTPETAEAGTIVLNGGTFISSVLNAGQTVDLGPMSALSISSRFDPGSTIVFTGPNTLKINQGATFDAAVRNFGVGDTIDLSGYQDGSLAQYIYGNDGVTHVVDPTVSVSYDGTNLVVSRGTAGSGGAVLATVPVGPGYVQSGFTATATGLSGGLQPPYLATDYLVTYATPGQPLPSLPVISGTEAKQPTTDLVPVSPFAHVGIADANPGAVDTAYITTYGTVSLGGINYVGTASTGTLSNLGGGTLIAGATGDTYEIAGTPAAVQSALDGLVFTPIAHQTSPGQTVTTDFTINVIDQYRQRDRPGYLGRRHRRRGPAHPVGRHAPHLRVGRRQHRPALPRRHARRHRPAGDLQRHRVVVQPGRRFLRPHLQLDDLRRRRVHHRGLADPGDAGAQGPGGLHHPQPVPGRHHHALHRLARRHRRRHGDGARHLDPGGRFHQHQGCGRPADRRHPARPGHLGPHPDRPARQRRRARFQGRHHRHRRRDDVRSGRRHLLGCARRHRQRRHLHGVRHRGLDRLRRPGQQHPRRPGVHADGRPGPAGPERDHRLHHHRLQQLRQRDRHGDLGVRHRQRRVDFDRRHPGQPGDQRHLPGAAVRRRDDRRFRLPCRSIRSA